MVSFNLTEEEIVYAKRIVDEINKQIQKQFVPPNPENDLAARLAGLGGKEKVEAPPIIGMSDEYTLILPDDVPKEPPLKKVGNKESQNDTEIFRRKFPLSKNVSVQNKTKIKSSWSKNILVKSYFRRKLIFRLKFFRLKGVSTENFVAAQL